MKSIDISNTPYLYDEIFVQLPDPLKTACQVFTNHRERDLYLISQLSALSGCFPNIYSKYRGITTHTNFNSFIVAPASSGKHSMSHAIEALQGIIDAYKPNSPSGGSEDNDDIPHLCIPGNSSSSAIISQLFKNNGCGIIFETEADSLSNSIKQKWGDFSDIVRKAFHNETISISRVGDHRIHFCEKPKLAVSLSGTPGQIQNLISNTENGLFSRFTIYIFESPLVWEDVSPLGNPICYDEFFEKTSLDLLQCYEWVGDNNIKIELTEHQWSLINTFGEEWTKYAPNVGKEFIGTIRRHASVILKISMILTVLRASGEKSEVPKVIECRDEDLNSANYIIRCLIHHAMEVYKLLSNGSENPLPVHLDTLLRLLPNNRDIQKHEILSLWESEVSPKTATNYLKKLTEMNKVVKIKHGCYRVASTEAA